MSNIDGGHGKKTDWNGDVSSLLRNIYRCADKSSWYDSVASIYDRTRPRYPQAILNKMQQVVKLQPGKTVLEIGAGPGIITPELAKSGANIVSLEPSKSACAIARDKCAAYSNVEVVNTTFEDWDLNTKKFDVVLAATSFHWVTPEVRYFKTASALKENGHLVLLWNTPPQPSIEVHQSLRDIYQTHAPEFSKYEGHQQHQENIGKIGKAVVDSGYFQKLTSDCVASAEAALPSRRDDDLSRMALRHRLIIPVRYTVENYLALLSTLSPYIRLSAKQREALFAQLKQKLAEFTSDRYLDLSYLSLLQIFRKS